MFLQKTLCLLIAYAAIFLRKIYQKEASRGPRTIAFISLVLLLSLFTVRFPWPQHQGGDVRKGPYSAITPAGPAVEYSDWPIFRGDQRLSGRRAGDLPGTWTLAWKYPTGAEIKSSPVIAGGVVFIGSSDGKVYAVGLKEGKQVWEFSTGGAVEAPPLFLAGTVYAGSTDGTMYALDAESGRCRWRCETGGKIVGSANWGTSESGEDAIVFGSYDNMLYCVNAGNGEKLWTYQTTSYVNGSPAVVDGRVIVGGCDEHVHIVSIEDGSLVAKIHAGSHIAASVAVDKGLAFVGHYQNKIICIDLSTYEIMWEYGDKRGDPFCSSPALGRDRIIAGSRDRLLHCINRDSGKKIWTFATKGEIDSSPVICGAKVVAGSADGRVYVLDLDRGDLLWTYEIGAAITGSPAVSGDTLVIGAEDGFVYAFRPR